MDKEQEKIRRKEQNAIWLKAGLPLTIPFLCVTVTMLLFLSLSVIYNHSRLYILFYALTWVFAGTVFILTIINLVMIPIRVMKLYQEKAQKASSQS